MTVLSPATLSHCDASITLHLRLILPLLLLRRTSLLLLMYSALALTPSTFGRLELELLLRLLLRCSSGSDGLSPLALAKMLSTSVKLTTPDSRPDIPAPEFMPGLTPVTG